MRVDALSSNQYSMNSSISNINSEGSSPSALHWPDADGGTTVGVAKNGNISTGQIDPKDFQSILNSMANPSSTQIQSNGDPMIAKYIPFGNNVSTLA